MLSIGEFSRLCFVSKKTLRHYDEIGLLRPEHIAENGYRYYTAGQLRTMLLIARLKSYSFSLPEIAAVLARPEGDYLAERLREKRELLAAQLQNTRRILRQLDEDADKLNRRMDMMELHIPISTATLAPQTLYGLRKRIDVKDFTELMGQLFSEVAQRQIQPLGPPQTFYFEEEFSPEDTEVEVCLPVAPGTPGAREVPGGLHCLATLTGPYTYESFTATYAALLQWVEDNGYRVRSAPFERYVRGGPDAPPEDNLTEIYFPIEK